MLHEVIVAGFGGQGVMLVGQLLCYAGMIESKSVAWIPSYGPEMRGGTANCQVVVSDEEMGSPVVSRPSVVLAMNRPSLEKFESAVKPQGTLIYNSSLIEIEPSRNDITSIAIPANQVATELGNPRVANMVMLGALIRATGAVAVEAVEAAMKKTFDGKKAELIPINLEALTRGIALASAF